MKAIIDLLNSLLRLFFLLEKKHKQGVLDEKRDAIESDSVDFANSHFRVRESKGSVPSEEADAKPKD